jgi:hypothetical protein
MLTLPEFRVGEPLSCGSLGVFPLFSERSLFPDRALDYLLPNEAMEGGTVVVTEVSEAGSVPEVRVRNDGDLPVLMLDGTELRGGKQCRVLNTSVLLGGRSETLIPVSCVERGRWEHSPKDFSSGSHCPPSLRGIIKEGFAPGGRVVHHSDQLRVWMEIRRKHERMGVSSETGDISDALEAHREKVERLKAEFPYPAGANGIAVALGGAVILIDLLDKPATLEKIWGRLQEGMLLDLLEKPDPERQVTSDVSAELYCMRNLPWYEVRSVSLGQAFRARDNTMVADVLLHEGMLLHGSASLRYPRC